LVSSFNLKSSLAVEAEVVAVEVDEREEVEVVVDSHRRRLRLVRLLPARLHPPRPRGQVLAALRLVLAQQVQQAVLPPLPGRPVALQPRRRPKLALGPTPEARRVKAQQLHSVRPELVQMPQAPVRRLVR
jgi:hypothetical protein